MAGKKAVKSSTKAVKSSKKEVKLSEIYTVYWEYLEKARRFVRERGNSAFGQGSEANAVPRISRLSELKLRRLITVRTPSACSNLRMPSALGCALR